ncbi:hypothetical protein CL684_00470 [Candidatus Campbellbacteria bacterium]|nr:hypothetical protein [Candidatus Campbellbacteria bacterium]|tara:strand:+ start:306 stop:1025 length:720 start_codon:yes stop_codon:yes gene_type:complete
MKHSYKIMGMTCDSCKEKITQALQSIPEISDVKINREQETAEVFMNEHVQTPTMQKSLDKIGNYRISMNAEISISSMKKSSSHIKDLIPLFVIVGAVLLFSIITTLTTDQDFSFGMRMFMGGFFVVFGTLKAIKLKDFAIAYKEYDLLAMRSTSYAYSYPFIELCLGILYFTNLAPFVTNIITIFIMGIGAVGVYRKLRKKEEIPCACLGTVFKVPMTWVTLVENLLMVAMAIIMIVLM